MPLGTGGPRLAHVSDESDVPDRSDIDPELEAQMADVESAMAEARSRLAEVPAEVVVTNHVMGLYELAAIHLSSTPPDFHAASLAIDAVGCLVDGLGDRLGDEYPTMRDALSKSWSAACSARSVSMAVSNVPETTASKNGRSRRAVAASRPSPSACWR